MKRLLRGVAYAVIPGEVALVACLLAGVRPPAPVLAAAEAAMLVLLVAEAAVFVRLRRQGHSNRSAVRELVPEPVLRLTGHELRLMWSFVLWVARRRHGVGPDAQAFGHARDQAALMFGFGFVCVVETVGMSYLLSGWPVVHAIVLVLDVYSGVFFVFGLHAASVTRPHVLSPDALRVRKGAHVDVRIPLERIASASYELRFTHTRQDGVLDLAVGGQTSLTLELSEPVVSVGLLGKERRVRTVRIHADDARALLRALTQARSALSPPPDRPAERPAERTADRPG